MILVYRTCEGHLEAVIEFWLVNETGQPDPHGRAVWVNQLELNPGVDSKHLIRRFIQRIAYLHPLAGMAFWYRLDSTNLRIHHFSRARLLRQPATQEVPHGV